MPVERKCFKIKARLHRVIETEVSLISLINESFFISRCTNLGGKVKFRSLSIVLKLNPVCGLEDFTKWQNPLISDF